MQAVTIGSGVSVLNLLARYIVWLPSRLVNLPEILGPKTTAIPDRLQESNPWHCTSQAAALRLPTKPTTVYR